MPDETDETAKVADGSQNPYEGLNVPRRNELSVTEVLAHLKGIIKKSLEGHKPFFREDIKGELQEETNYEQLALRGPVQVAQGDTLVLAVNSMQGEALKVIFGSDATNIIVHHYYASVEKPTEGEKNAVEARVKFAVIQPETPNHFVISQGLAQRLAVTEGEDIRITNVYMKPGEVNLDKI